MCSVIPSFRWKKKTKNKVTTRWEGPQSLSYHKQSLSKQGCTSCGTCSYPELTEDHVLTSAYVKFFRIVTRNAVKKSFWRKKDCSWPPLNKYAINIWLSSLRIRAHLSWRTGKHLHALHDVLWTYSTCSRILGYHNLCSPMQPMVVEKVHNSTISRLYKSMDACLCAVFCPPWWNDIKHSRRRCSKELASWNVFNA